MIEIIKKVYKCEYCLKPYFSKYFATLHESDCAKNPLNKRKCFGCSHLTKTQTNAIITDSQLHQTIKIVDVLFCLSRKIYLHPPKIQNRGNPYFLKDSDNEPMPTECELFTDNPDKDEVLTEN